MIRIAAIAVVVSGSWGLTFVQDFDQTSCDEFLVASRAVAGKQVGPSACMMQETDVALDGRTFRRLDIGLDGTVEGAVTDRPDTREYFTNAPDLVLPQLAAPGAPATAIASYTGAKGASMTVIYPLRAAAWNGKMWVTAHGGELSLGQGLVAWHRNLDRKDPLKDLNAYDRLILSKGYVLVKTRRATAAKGGETSATLADGRMLDGVAFKDTARYVTDFAALARHAIAKRLGQPPSRTYFYGHGSGASIGHALNYVPALNTDPDGRPVFDGILADDPSAGLWLAMLAVTPARLVPQIDVIHQMHNAVWRAPRADYISMSALANARQNIVLHREKGLASKTRSYEVRSVSHDGGETPASDPTRSYVALPRLMDGLMDHLDRWVTKGAEPPPSRSDSTRAQGPSGTRTAEQALALPEVACPLGVYYPWPVITGPQTAFAAFGSSGLEPLYATGMFVDMNANGIRDHRETITEAWRRLGLLRRGEDLTQQRYSECVRASADRLRQDLFFSESTVGWYTEQAKKSGIAPSTGQR
jgi:hypothetical protein